VRECLFEGEVLYLLDVLIVVVQVVYLGPVRSAVMQDALGLVHCHLLDNTSLPSLEHYLHLLFLPFRRGGVVRQYFLALLNEEVPAGVLVRMRPGCHFDPAGRQLSHYVLVCVVVVDGLGRDLFFILLVILDASGWFAVELCGLAPHVLKDYGHSAQSVLHCHHAPFSLFACLFLLLVLEESFLLLQVELFCLVLLSDGLQFVQVGFELVDFL
jgi:hypothetical protein